MGTTQPLTLEEMQARFAESQSLFKHPKIQQAIHNLKRQREEETHEPLSKDEGKGFPDKSRIFEPQSYERDQALQKHEEGKAPSSKESQVGGTR
ncbi:hypothetical protein L7F22_016330 [Adiantum nelumboides]|nr:hypothetical protein [Adiantum nelumboides]